MKEESKDRLKQAQLLAEESVASSEVEAAENGRKNATIEYDENGEEKGKYTIIPDLYISRKVTVKGGKRYADYYVHGVLRGVEVKVRVKPGKDSDGFADVSAYTMLNIVFGEKDEAQFSVRAFKRRDSATNRLTSGLTYYAYDKDVEDGEEYVAPLRFETSPDKAVISKLIEIANKKYALGLTV